MSFSVRHSMKLPLALACFLGGLAQAEEPNPERNAYFGETHVHTSWSLDAFALGNMVTTPEDAYKYF